MAFLYFTDHQNAELATMERSVLDWVERERSPHRELLQWYRALLALRHELPELTNGRRVL